MLGGLFSLPPVVKNLLIINGLFFLAMTVSGGQFMGVDLHNYLALHNWESQHFIPHQYVTYLFMHGGFYHLLFNMFALFMFGRNLEVVWGPKKFLIYYMVCGIGAGVLHSVVSAYEVMSFQETLAAFIQSPDVHLFRSIAEDVGLALNQNVIYDWETAASTLAYEEGAIKSLNQYLSMLIDVPTVGASGAVFGILLAYGMMFPNTEILIYFLFPIKAKYFVVLYGIIELMEGVQNAPGDNVAHFAHLGGMLFGFLIIKYWKSKGEFYS